MRSLKGLSLRLRALCGPRKERITVAVRDITTVGENPKTDWLY